MAVTKFPTVILHNDIEDNKKRIGVLEGHDKLQDDRIHENKIDIGVVTIKSEAVEKAVIKIVASNDASNKFNKWVVGVITSVLLVILGALVTGQAQIVFP